MLQVRTLTKAFRGLVAVKDVSFDVADNEIVALIGPNGAGKTTCFNMIAGALRPTAGSVLLRGEVITGLPPERIAMMGLVRTFQIVRPMPTMTVLENAMIGAFARTADVDEALDIASGAIERVGLEGKSDVLAGSLTLPDRKNARTCAGDCRHVQAPLAARRGHGWPSRSRKRSDRRDCPCVISARYDRSAD